MPFVEGVPTVTVQLDKPRELAYTMGVVLRMQQMQQKFGMDLDLTDGDGKIDPRKMLPVLPVYVWASLDAGGRAELTPEQIGDMLHPGNLVAVMEALGSLATASNPEASADAGPTPAGPKLAATG